MSKGGFQKIGLFPPGYHRGRGLVDGPDWEECRVSPAQPRVLALGVPELPGREKLALVHTALLKLSVVKKEVDEPLISGAVLWGRLHSSPGSGRFHCPFDSPTVLTFARLALRLFYSLRRGGVRLGHFGVNSCGPVEESPGHVLCFCGPQGGWCPAGSGGAGDGRAGRGGELWERVAW